MHDGTAQDCSVARVDVEMEDLDTTPDIFLEEITAGIAALRLMDKGEDYRIWNVVSGRALNGGKVARTRRDMVDRT